MRYKIAGIITVLGILVTGFGAWLKILHRPNANLYLTIGIWSESIGFAALIWFIFELVRKNNERK